MRILVIESSDDRCHASKIQRNTEIHMWKINLAYTDNIYTIITGWDQVVLLD